MRIVIAAYKAGDVEHIERLLHRKLREFFADVQVQLYKEAGSFAEFFDADAPKSLDMALKLRSKGIKTPIVFFSDSHNQALGCYEAHPAGYLVKPFAYAPLCGILDWHRDVFTPALRYLDVVSGRSPVKVYLADIQYIEIQAHTCLIHRFDDVVETNRSLASITAQLDGEAFLRVHRKFLANLQHIAEETHESFRMDNGHVLPIGTRNADKIKKSYLAHKKMNEETS